VIDGGPGGLVVMEQVTTQQQHVHIILLGQLQDLFKGLERIELAVFFFVPNTLEDTSG
jgi:hypothetical protein